MYELAIIGGGPAAISAGVYASRKHIKTVLIADQFGGQSIVSDGVENWIGDIKISGIELAQKLEKHLNAYAGEYVNVQKGQRVEKVEKTENGFKLTTNKGEEFEAKAILVATGASRRKIQVEGADRLEHKGLTYCATCDGPLFADKDVAVIGGGNSALEGAAQLSAYTKSVSLIHRRDEFRGDPITVEAIKKDPKINLILNAETTEILGDDFVSGLKYKDKETGEEKELKLDGIFVEIGSVPTNYFVKDLVDLDDDETIKIDPWNQRTSVEGIWAAGDVTNVKYHQNNIAAGDAVKALEDIYIWLKQQ
jgi:alkyl hydroperoxide reductase subunit F